MCIRDRCRSRQTTETYRRKRVVYGQGVRVMHERAGLTTRSRTLPYRIPAEKWFAKPSFTGDKFIDAATRHVGIGDPIVKPFHQFGLRDWGQLLDRKGLRRQVFVFIAIETRMLARELNKAAQPLQSLRSDHPR